MKINFKYSVVVFSVAFIALAPLSAHAASGSGKQSVAAAPLSASYCTEIDSLAAKLLGSIAEQERNYKRVSGERMQELTDRRTVQATAELNRRSIWDENRNEHFKLLEARAKTPAEKKAIATFKSSIEKAVTSRKSAVDSAHAAFRVSADKALKDRLVTFNAATTTFKVAIDRAAAKARAECVAKQSSTTARDVFRTALKDARTSFENAVKNLALVNVDTAVKVRNAALEKAQKDFAASVDKALKELKAAAPTI